MCTIFTLTSCTDESSDYKQSNPDYKQSNPDYLDDIASIKIFIYEAAEKFGEIEIGELYCGCKLEFDEANNIIKNINYNNNGKRTGLTEFKYNNNNQLTASTSYDHTGEEFYNMELTYNGKFYATRTYKLEDTNGRIEHLNNGKYITEEKVYENDTLVNIHKTKKEGYTYIYTTYDADGNEKGTTFYEYDKNELLIKYTTSKGKTTEVIRNKKGLPTKFINTYIFNGNNLYSSDVYIGGNQNAEMEYEYDNKGNWIKKQVRVMEKGEKDKFYIVTRDIQYR